MKRLKEQQIYNHADFYDMEFDSRREDLNFYRHVARRTQGPILEIACGTGRLTVPIAKLGRPTFGLDINPGMLNNARQRAQRESTQVCWIKSNATSFSLKKRFGFIFMATNALQHVQQNGDVLKLFRTVKHHLRPNGLFVFDVFNPDIQKLARTRRYRQKQIILSQGSIINVDARSRYEAAIQILKFELFYSQRRKKDFLVKEVEMRCFFPQELDALITYADLRLKKKLGSFNGDAFQSISPQQICFCY